MTVDITYSVALALDTARGGGGGGDNDDDDDNVDNVEAQ